MMIQPSQAIGFTFNYYFMKISYIVFFLVIALDSNLQAEIKEPWQAQQQILVHQNYEEALNIYKQNYQLNKGGFSGTDFNNMINVAKYLKDTTFLTSVYYKSIKMGLCKEHLSFSQLKGLDRSIQVDDSIFNYLNELLLLLDLDQEARINYDDPDNRRKVDSLNFIKFQILCNQYGFPSFENLDLRCFSKDRGLRYPSVLRTLLLHFSEHEFKNIHQVLADALQEGKIPISDFLQYSEYFEINPYPNILIECNNNMYMLKLDQSDIASIDSARQRIGYMSYAEQLEMEIAYYENGDLLPFKFGAPFIPYTYDLSPSILKDRFILVF